MHDLFTKGLSYSAVNSARSALSNYFMGENLSNSEFSVVSHPLIKRYMKGYVCTGQTLKVLSFTSGQRCRTLTNLNISSMKKTGKYYLYQFKNHMKQNRPGHIVTSFYVPKYCEQELCTYRTLENYPERTLPVRAVEHIALFFVLCKAFLPRWVEHSGTLDQKSIETKWRGHQRLQSPQYQSS